ncbi:MAG: hypothetical protein KDI66_17275 [Xanthomonadales bacterium]|nr:hypothetical protein [Xanthomonadales bacterium]
MKQTLRDLAILAALAFTHSATAGLPGSMSGTWYNPAQSGHGLSLDVLAADRAVAIWHVFDADGQPVTLYIDGHLDGRLLTGPAYAPVGMRFGSFDPAELQLPVWGQVAIDFSSCDQAQLSWSSSRSGFASGQMPIVRLTQADGQRCELPPENALPPGLYAGDMQAGLSSPATVLEGVVDREGRLWGFERKLQDASAPLPIPGPTWVGSHSPRVFRIEPEAVDGVVVNARSAIYTAHAFWLPTSLDVIDGSGSWRVDAPAGPRGQFESNGFNAGTHTWHPQPSSVAQLVSPVDLGLLQGSYDFVLRGQFFELPATVIIDANGGLCMGQGDGLSPETCQFRGTISAAEGQYGLLEFRAKDQRKPALAEYHGRAWLSETNTGRELVMVGDNGTVGLLAIAKPRQ